MNIKRRLQISSQSNDSFVNDEQRVQGNSHAWCEAGEKTESGAVAPLRSYLSLFSLPDDFDKILATMRSRNVSVSIILQNVAQLKALFEKQWESIL